MCKGEEGVQGRRLYKKEVHGRGGYVQDTRCVQGREKYIRERVCARDRKVCKRE